jgi:hypothetical protein
LFDTVVVDTNEWGCVDVLIVFGLVGCAVAFYLSDGCEVFSIFAMLDDVFFVVDLG